MLARLGLIAVVFCLIGCDSSSRAPEDVVPANSQPADSPSVKSVQAVISTEIGLPLEEISPEATFEDLGADGLDFARIITETQDQLDVVVSTEKLAEVTGEMDPKQMPAKLTVRQLAEIVEAAQASPAPGSSPDGLPGETAKPE